MNYYKYNIHNSINIYFNQNNILKCQYLTEISNINKYIVIIY